MVKINKMKPIISKKEFDESMRIKGEVMGIAFAGDRFILKKKKENRD